MNWNLIIIIIIILRLIMINVIEITILSHSWNSKETCKVHPPCYIYFNGRLFGTPWRDHAL